MHAKVRDHKKQLVWRPGAVCLLMVFFCLAFLIPVTGSLCAQSASGGAADTMGGAADMTAGAADTSDQSDILSGVTSYQGRPLIRGWSGYLSGSSSSDVAEVFFYSDGYFLKPATVYDEHLASMSLCLAGSAMASNDGGRINYKNKSKNIRALLDRIGCTDICVNTDFTVKPGEDTIGVCIARKTIRTDEGDYTLIPIGIRGAGYENEWLGNMKVGDTGDANGFRSATDRAKQAVDEYIKNYDIDTDRVKFWIAGFSRAGAVADMLTAALTDDYDPSGANVYGYSFATPQGAYEKERSYPNSHCSVSSSDVVPKVVPSYMGFSHYGDETVLRDEGKGFQAYRMSVDTFNAIFVEVPQNIYYTPIDTRFSSQDEFTDELIEALRATVAPDRQTFTQKPIEGGPTLEEILSRLLKFLMTSDAEHVSEVKNSFTNLGDIVGFKGLTRFSTVLDAIHTGLGGMEAEERDEIYTILWGWFKPGLESSLTGDEYTELAGMWKSLCYVLIELAHYDYYRSGAEGFALIGTLIKNISSIGEAHGPEKYLELIKKNDSFYNTVTGKAVMVTDEQVRLGDALYVDALIKKDGKDIALIEAGRTVMSEDESVYARYKEDEGSDLKEISGTTLFTRSGLDTERSIVIPEKGEYEIRLSAGQREGMEFLKWIDETGVEVSSQPVYSLIIREGEGKRGFIKPVYRTASATLPTPNAGTKAKEGGQSTPVWPWVMGGVVLLLGAGGGVVLSRKKANRK